MDLYELASLPTQWLGHELFYQLAGNQPVYSVYLPGSPSASNSVSEPGSLPSAASQSVSKSVTHSVC